MRHDELEALIPLHALGALDGEDRRAIEAHLEEGCPRCEQLLPEFAAVAAHLPESLQDVTVPSRLQQRVLERIAQEGLSASQAGRSKPVAPPSRRWWWLLPWGAAFAAAAASLLLFFNGLALRDTLERERSGSLQERAQLTQEARRLRDQLAQQEADVSSLQGRLARQEAVIRAVQDPQSRVVALRGLEPAPGASGKVIWRPVRQTALLYVYHLPALPPNTTYQLWTIADRPISGGVFGVDDLGNAAMRLLAVPGHVKTFAVTIEPAGGMSQPTGAIYLAGSL